MPQPFTFIHAADLHLGTPFTGLAGAVPELAADLAAAPFAALEALTAEALRRKAAFVILSGDIFDTPEPSLTTGSRFIRALRPLTGAGIPVLAVAGNHDHLPLPEHLGIPEGIYFFPADKAVSVPVKDKNGTLLATVAGISHGRPQESRDLVPQIVEVLKDAPGFRVAVLHANIGGQRGFQPYAPAPLSELLDSGAADYWALGHIHQQRILNNDPPVVYPGCIQGRSVNEPGPKGAAVVEVSSAGTVKVGNIALDAVEFRHLEVGIEGAASLPELLELIRQEAAQYHRPGHKLLLRLTLRGASTLNRQLRQEEHYGLQELISGQLPPGAWLESVDIATVNPPSRGSSGLAAEIPPVKAAAAERLAADAAILKLRRDLFSGFSPEELNSITDAAAALLCDMLAGNDTEQ